MSHHQPQRTSASDGAEEAGEIVWVCLLEDVERKLADWHAMHALERSADAGGGG